MAIEKKRTAVNLVSQIISFIVSLGVSFFLTPYITARLGKEVYGFVGMAYQFTSYITIFTVAFNGMLNIFVATSYHKGEIGKAQKYFSSVAIIDIAIAIILILPFTLFILNMEKFLNVPTEHLYDIKLLWAFIFSVFIISMASAYFNCSLFVKNRIDLSAMRNIGSNVLRGFIILVAFSFFPTKVWYVGLAAFISGIYLCMTNYKYNRKLTPELMVSRKYFDFKAVKELVSVGIWSTVSQITYNLISGLDLIFSNIFIDSLAMGYISYAQTVPVQISVLTNQIKNVFTPSMTKVYAKGNINDFIAEVNSTIKICGFLCSIPILGFCVFGTSFYGLWLPSLSEQEVIKINILSIMILFPSIFDVYVSPLHNVNGITRNVRLPVIVSLIVGVANIFLELLLIKTTGLGVYAIEIATAILMFGKVFLFTPIYAAQNIGVRKRTFYKPLLKGTASSAVVTGIFIIIKFLFPISNWFSLIIVCGIAGAIGYCINYFIVLDRKERKIIQNMIAKKLMKQKK